jgi:CheY-like chemotaxis protein
MGMAPFPGEATGETAGRGKSKRRRFNLSVLENIEKMVQSAAAGVANQASAMTAPQSAPVAPTASPGPFTAPAGDRVSAPSAFGPFGAPAASIPAPSISSPATPPQEPTLPLDSTPASRTVAEPPADEVASSAPSDGAVQPESASVPESQETENETALAQEPDQRSSMRSMMFGEEHPAPRPSRYGRRFQLKPEPKPVVEEPEPGVVEAEPVTAGSEPTGEEPEPPVGQFEEAATAELAVEEPTLYQPSLEETPAELGDHEESPSAAAESMETIAEPDQAIEVSTGSWEADQSTFSSTADEATMDEPASSISQVGAEEAAVSPEPVIDESEPFSFSSGFGETAGTSSVADSVTPPAEETPQGSGPTMVIIEDDESVAQYYATLFRGNGYRVEVANDGVSGVDLCSKVQPAVILLDVMMPRQNGILVLQTLRASDETRETPVVVLSNFSEPTLIKRALQLGALEYVIKTQVEGAALLAAVPRWLNREKAFAA